MKRLVLAAALLGSVALYAQQPGFTRKMLQDHDLSVSERHAVQALQLEIAGEPPRTVKAGEAFFVPTYVVEKGKPVASPAK